MAYNKVEYNNAYNKVNYERLNILVPKGMKDYIEQRALDLGFRYINKYVNWLLWKDLSREDNPMLNNDEQLIINLYRYGDDEIKRQLYEHALRIDASLSPDDKKRMFDENIIKKEV